MAQPKSVQWRNEVAALEEGPARNPNHRNTGPYRQNEPWPCPSEMVDAFELSEEGRQAGEEEDEKRERKHKKTKKKKKKKAGQAGGVRGGKRRKGKH